VRIYDAASNSNLLTRNSESFNFSSFICLPFVQRLPSNIVAVTADIRNITSSTLSLLYVALSTLPRLRHLEVTNLPEYLRHPSLFIIPFNFISSGHTFSLSALKSTLDRLAHLDFYPSTSQDLTTHPSLGTSLRELILHMPQLSPEMVSAIFSLQNLTKLRLVEPAGLEEAWALLPSHQPEFTNLKEFGFGSRKDGAWPLKNPHYYFLDSIPHGFIESILSRNPRLERLGLIHLTQSIISVLPTQSLQELEVAFSFDFTGKPTISVQTLTAVFQSGVFKNLCRCYLPFTGLKLNVPFLKTMAGCSMLVDLQIVDGMDGDEGYKKEPQRPKGLPLGEERDGQRYPGGLAGKVLFDVALKEFARWQDEHRSWRMELVHGMCEDQETYVLAEPFLTVGRSPSFNSVNVRCMLDQASLRHRFSGHGI